MEVGRIGKYLTVGIIILWGISTSISSADPVTWWVVDISRKVTSETKPPIDGLQPLHLHAARQEYAPFQIAFTTDQPTSLPVPVLDYPMDYFSVRLYQEAFVPLLFIPEPEIFSMARLTDIAAIADGLRPAADPFPVTEYQVAALWADVYVLPDTPAGDYVFTISLPGYGERTVTITVYPVDLQPTAAMNVIIPLEANWTIPHYAPGDETTLFQNAVNQLLVNHGLVPGTLTGEPEFTGDGWDFSAFDAELDALVPGTIFYTPLPYDEWNERYYIIASNGAPYEEARFDDLAFLNALERFFDDLAAYLQSKGHLGTALVYPVDETRWVADEPDHNGPKGYERLASWTGIIRRAGLRVSASRVLPGTFAPGWLPSQNLADDLHVHVDLFDAAPDVFAAWNATPGQSTSLYLNEYGDLIDMPASIHRGLIWHAYGRGIRMIAGYAAMEWVDEQYGLVDPWTEPEALYPQSGYGGGALVWPGPLPSVRLKLLREGVEDARLLDLYANLHGEKAAQELAASLTPGDLADQNPSPDIWDNAHTALLTALTNNGVVNVPGIPPPENTVAETSDLIDFDAARIDRDRWEFGPTTDVTLIESPWEGSGNALTVEFADSDSYMFYWIGEADWQKWDALEFDVSSQSPYFTELDVAAGDADGNYLLLRGGALLIGPESQRVLRLPLVIPFGKGEPFNWSKVAYLEITVNTTIERRDGFGERHTYDTGSRLLIFDNFRLTRYDD